jgi:hypothetical protein
MFVCQEMVPHSDFLAAIKELEFRRMAETSEIDAKIVMLETELARTEQAVELATAEIVKVHAKTSCMVLRSELQAWVDKLDAAKAQETLVSTEHEKHVLYLSDQLQLKCSEISVMKLAMEVGADFGRLCHQC